MVESEEDIRILKKILEKVRESKRIEKVIDTYQQKSVTFSISAPLVMYNGIVKLAKRMGVSRSELVRHCIFESLKTVEFKQRVFEDPDSDKIIIDGREVTIIGEA